MEFDKSKILTVVTADQAIACKKGWFSNDIPSLKIYIERGDEPKGIQGVDVHSEYPFRESYPSDGSFACKYRYFYPAKEPTYAERQAQWVKENNVKVGTKVRVTRTFTEDEGGSCCFAHNDLVGETGIVDNISATNLGVYINDEYFKALPYFALEVIKEPTYRPFANAKEYKPHRDEWVVQDTAVRRIISYNCCGVTVSQPSGEGYGMFITFETAFKKLKFESGEPFGVKYEQDTRD